MLYWLSSQYQTKSCERNIPDGDSSRTKRFRIMWGLWSVCLFAAQPQHSSGEASEAQTCKPFPAALRLR
jgi:hypothetical protein